MIKPIKRICNWHEPEVIVKRLIQEWGEAGLVWLDGDSSKLGQWATIGIDPIKEMSCRGLPKNNNSNNPFEVLRNLPSGHWTGWLSYEAGAWLDSHTLWKEDSMATLWVVSHDPVLKFDLQNQKLYIEGLDKTRLENVIRLIDKIETKKSTSITTPTLLELNHFEIPIDSWQWLTSRDDYASQVDFIKKLINKGDIFQANLTACCKTKLNQKISPINIFSRLRNISCAPFSGLIIGRNSTADEAIMSASPERFLKVSATGDVESRPIKGTRPRNKNQSIDAAMAASLITSPKDRAENIMIVDLIRNDLGKVCESGSIKVSKLVGLESYMNVHHLTSVVEGHLDKNKTWVDLLEASWPGGSITGTPKLRACQRLAELEPIARGPYCGSLFRVNWDGSFDSNILIRTILLKSSYLRAYAGCGIVAESNANDEIEELKWKLMPILSGLK